MAVPGSLEVSTNLNSVPFVISSPDASAVNVQTMGELCEIVLPAAWALGAAQVNVRLYPLPSVQEGVYVLVPTLP